MMMRDFERLNKVETLSKIVTSISILLIVFSIGCMFGARLEKKTLRANTDEIIIGKIDEPEETTQEEELSEDDKIIIAQREKYFEEIKPIKFYGVDFYQNHKKYKITTPQKTYGDYDCTFEVINPIITSTNVVEIIMNEENSRFGLRTEDNKLVWVKEEPRIEELQ